MNLTIFTDFCQITELPAFIKGLLIDKYNLPKINANQIVEKKIERFTKELNPKLYCLVEYPYIDKMYRDIYYKYYSSKLEAYYRDTIRVSFFNHKVKREDFSNVATKDKFIKNGTYLGFLTIRPTFPNVIGRNALSPLAKKDTNFVCCQAKINSTVGFLKFKVNCFPHASQDNQIISCAETTVWSLLEYFGNKYPEYKPVLPSAIHTILHKFSYKRLMPTEGLTAEQLTYAVRELGFGAMIYSRVKSPLQFDTIISTYIESGIPVIGLLKGKKIGHAVNIIGREFSDPKLVTAAPSVRLQDIGKEEPVDGKKPEKPKKRDKNTPIIDFGMVKRKYVFIDDNHAPYQLADLDEPCKYYEDDKWSDCQIQSIVVPLHSRIYLDAVRARHNFFQYLKSSRFGLTSDDTRVIKIFLASSRSYKEYLALNKGLENRIKTLFLSLTMPKFIWIAEIAKKSVFEKEKCDGIIIQDATEPIMHTDRSMLGNLSLIAGFVDGKYFDQNLGKFKQISTFAASFENYKENLK